MSSPTQRSLALYRELGYTAQVVEKFNHHVGPHGIRVDLFGCIDIVAARPGEILGVQACAMSGEKAHLEKCLAESRLIVWLLAGGRFELCSWGKRVGTGTRARWTCRRLEAVWTGRVVFTDPRPRVGGGAPPDETPMHVTEVRP